MPRNVRNFWLEATIDGRQSVFTGGPQSKNGGFHLEVKQRSNGSVIRTLTVEGFADSDGGICLYVFGADGPLLYTHESQR